MLTQLIKSKPTVEDVKPKPGADGLEGDQLLPGDQLMSGDQPSPGTAVGDQLITGTKDQFNHGTEMLEEPQDTVPTLEKILPTEPTVHDEQTIPERDCGQGTGRGNGPEVSGEEENVKAKVVDIPTGSEDKENVTVHQEDTAKTLGCMEYNSEESHHLLPKVNPAQAGLVLKLRYSQEKE